MRNHGTSTSHRGLRPSPHRGWLGGRSRRLGGNDGLEADVGGVVRGITGLVSGQGGWVRRLQCIRPGYRLALHLHILGLGLGTIIEARAQ